jgi:hypothetical protein
MFHILAEFIKRDRSPSTILQWKLEMKTKQSVQIQNHPLLASLPLASIKRSFKQVV